MQTVTKTFESGCTSTLRAEFRMPQNAGLTYSLIETPPTDDSGPVYSILCVLHDEGGDEYDFVYDVSRIKERASEIIEQLCRGNVTPCTLKYVIADLLS